MATVEEVRQKMLGAQRTLQQQATSISQIPGYEQYAGYLKAKAQQMPTEPTVSTQIVSVQVPPDPSKYVQLSTGEWVAKVDPEWGGFDSLTPTAQQELMNRGIAGFQQYYNDTVNALFSGQIYQTARDQYASDNPFPDEPTRILSSNLTEDEQIVQSANYQTPGTFIAVPNNEGVWIEARIWNSLSPSEKQWISENNIYDYDAHFMSQYSQAVKDYMAGMTQYAEGAETEARSLLTPDLTASLIRLGSGEWVDRESAFTFGLPEEVQNYSKAQLDEWLKTPEGQLWKEGRSVFFDKGTAGYESWVTQKEQEFNTYQSAVTEVKQYLPQFGQEGYTPTVQDWARAVNAGLSSSSLQVLGMHPNDIERLRTQAEVFSDLSGYTKVVNGEYQYDIVAALVAGKVDPKEVALAFSLGPGDVDKLVKMAEAFKAMGTKYKDADGYQISLALADGVITRTHVNFLIDDPKVVRLVVNQATALQHLGKDDVNVAVGKGNLTAADLVALNVVDDLTKARNFVMGLKVLENQYKTDDGYDVVGAVMANKLSQAQINAIWSPEEVAGIMHKVNTLNTLQNYQLEDGSYSFPGLAKAMAEAGLGGDDLHAVGFDDATIKAASLLYAEAKTSGKSIDEYVQTTSELPTKVGDWKTIETPAGLAQSLWWGFTPWKEEYGESGQSYLSARGTWGFTGGVMLAVGKMAAPTIGIAALSIVAPPLGVGAAAALGGFLSYQTQQNWSTMSNSARALNVGMAALCFLPMLGAAGRALHIKSPIPQGALSPQRLLLGRSRWIGQQVMRAESQALKDMVRAIEQTYGKPLASQYRAMITNQTKLLDLYLKIDALVKQRGLLAKIEGAVGAKRLTATINNLQRQASVMEQSLKAQAQSFSSKFMDAPGYRGSRTKFESGRIAPGETPFVRTAAELAKMTDDELAAYSRGRLDVAEYETAKRIMESLGDDIIQNTRGMAQSITGGTSLKELKLALDKALARLREAQQKYGADASKWADYAYEAAVAQTKYELAQLGDANALMTQLVKIREAISTGKLAGKTLTPRQITQLEVKEMELLDLYHKTAWGKHMDVIVRAKKDAAGNIITDKDGNVVYEIPEPATYGGRARIGVAEPTQPPRLSARPVSLSTATMTSAQLARLLGAAAGVAGGIGLDAVSTKTIQTEMDKIISPEIEKITAPVVSPAIAPIIVPATHSIISDAVWSALSALVQNEAITTPEVATIVHGAIETGIENLTNSELENALEPQLKPLSKLALKTALKLKTLPLRFRWTPKPFMPFPPLKGGDGGRERRVPLGTVTWRQGELKAGAKKQTGVWWVWEPPYYPKERYRYTKRRPPEGAKVLDGPGSAYKTIQTLLGREAPKKLEGPLGIMDIGITKGRRIAYTKARSGKRRKDSRRPQLSTVR